MDTTSQNAQTKHPGYLPWILGGGVAVAAWWILRMSPDAFIVPVFCRIPAEIASRYYGVPLQKPELIFFAHGVSFEVIRPCGATDFFSMVAGLLAYLSLQILLRRQRGTGIPACAHRQECLCYISLLALLPLAWLVTIIANTIRLIVLVPTTSLMYRYLPERMFNVCRQSIGMLVFLTTFTLLWEGIRYVTRNREKP